MFKLMGNFLGKWHVWKTKNKYNEEVIAYTMNADPAAGDEVNINGYVEDGVYYGYNGSSSWETHLEDVRDGIQVDYNKLPIKYARVAVHYETSPRSYSLEGTNLTCEDLNDTGATYMLYYEANGDVRQGVLTFNDMWGDDPCWGSDIDGSCFIFCHDGTVGVQYLG